MHSHRRDISTRHFFACIAAVIALCAVPASLFAQGVTGVLTVRPAKVELEVAPGETQTRMIRVTNTTSVPLELLLSFEDVEGVSNTTASQEPLRLKEGKIYKEEKVEAALKNFFKSDHILQLRELALKEVASQVERKVETEVTKEFAMKHEKFLSCISSNEITAKNVIRKTARLANYYHSKWYVMYVQTPSESGDKIALDKQRHLINNFKLATELGGEIIKVESKNVAKAIIEQAEQRNITTICVGKPHLSLLRIILVTNVFNELLKKLSANDIDLVILS